MASFINTNTASLNAQRNLSTSQSALSTSLQRLSSGLRINSAKDDAAGLAIASRFTSQIRGTDQAVRNANDGISLAQTAEGSLGEISNNLQRIRELSVQATNSTNSASDRATINEEVQQRLAEIDRTAAQTTFNGQKVLDGSFGTASFQVGANVGETINIELGASMRTSAIGKIAGATSSTFGADAVSGGVGTGPITKFDFRAATPATGGSYSVSPKTINFSAAFSGGSGGSLALTGLTQTNFAAAGAEIKASNTQTYTGASFDFSAAGALAQFDVTIGAKTVGVTLNANYTDAAGVASAIQTQLAAAVTGATVTNTNGVFKIEAPTGTTTAAIEVKAVDGNAAAAGFVASEGTVGAVAGAAASAATFKVDGTVITLNTDLTNAAGVAAAIQTQLQAQTATANYSVSTSGPGAFTIKNNTVGSAAVAITNNSTGLTGGWVAAGAAGTPTAGVAAVSNKDTKVLVDGASVTLDEDFDDLADMAATLQTKIRALGNTTDAAAGTGHDYSSYTVTSDAGKLKISRGIGEQGAVAITADSTATTNQGTNATASGLLSGTGTAGAAAITSDVASFQIDGTTINLNANYGTLADLKAAVNSQLTASAGNTTTPTTAYSAEIDDAGTGIKITGTAGTTPVAISNLTGTAGAAGFAAKTGTGGVSAGSLSLSSFSVVAGSNKPVDLSGAYKNGQELVDAINSRVSGVTASIVDGKLSLASADAIKLEGASATATAAAGGLGFTATTFAADKGALSSVNTTTTAAANETIQRIDSALGSVNSMRSKFGSIQNRFESVIANLSSSSENMSAARSRIQDADFAAETATLTRGQILQQAGTAMLAQANSLPNGVMALLRG